MMRALFDSSGWLLFAADTLVKSLATLGLAGAAAWLLRGRGVPAQARNGVWVCCFAALLALPLLSLIRLALPPAAGEYSLPGRYHVPVPLSAPKKSPAWAASDATPPSARTESAPLPLPAFPGTRNSSAEPARAVSPPSTAPPPPARTRLFWLWPLGAILVLARTVAGLILVRRLARESSTLVADGPLFELLNDGKRALGVARPVTLRLSHARPALGGAAAPMTWGCLRPTILLPADAPSWDRERVRAVLLHELAHIARNDWAAQVLLARTVCALYWFHPLVWLAAAQLRAEAERACDESVLQAGMSAPEYAGHLLAVAQLLRSAAVPVLPFGRL